MLMKLFNIIKLLLLKYLKVNIKKNYFYFKIIIFKKELEKIMQYYILVYNFVDKN